MIATIARQAIERGMEVRIVTSDKDVPPTDRSARADSYNIRKNTYFDAKALKKDWGVRPDQVIDFQALVGDSVDNVPGVPLIGPKKACRADRANSARLKTFSPRPTKRPAVRNSTRTSRTSRSKPHQPLLVELNTNLPIEIDWEAARVKEPDRPRLLALFTELGFAPPGRRDAVASRSFPTKPPEKTRAAIERPRQPLPEAAADAATSHRRIGRCHRRNRRAPPSPPASSQWSPQSSGPAGPLPAAGPRPRPVSSSQLRNRRHRRSVRAIRHECPATKSHCVDLETTSLDAVQADIVGWAFSWQPRKGYYLPVRGPAGQTTLDPTASSRSSSRFSKIPNAEIVNQNIKYDMLVLRRAGVMLAGLGLDPMVGDYLLDAGARTHGLDALADKYLRHPMIPISELIGNRAEADQDVRGRHRQGGRIRRRRRRKSPSSWPNASKSGSRLKGSGTCTGTSSGR